MPDLGSPAVRVRESATFVDRDGRPLCRLMLGELPDGHGYLYAMQLPWGGHETDRTYDTLAEARAIAGEIYRLWGDAGAWQVQRWSAGSRSG